jgi:hypothetical protein
MSKQNAKPTQKEIRDTFRALDVLSGRAAKSGISLAFFRHDELWGKSDPASRQRLYGKMARYIGGAAVDSESYEAGIREAARLCRL